jgi:hypothetical protein
MGKKRGREPYDGGDRSGPGGGGPGGPGADPWPRPPLAPDPRVGHGDVLERDEELRRRIEAGLAAAAADAARLQRAANPPSGYYAGDTGIVGLGPLAALGRLLPRLARAAVVGKGVAPTVAKRAALSFVNRDIKRGVDAFKDGMRGPGPTPGSAVPRLRLDPSTAPREVLGALPGVGPKMADAIVATRKRRPFDSAKDFDDRVPGVGPRTMESLRPNLRFPDDRDDGPGALSLGGVGGVLPQAGSGSGSPRRPALVGVPGRAPQADRVWDDVLRGRSPRMIGPVRPDGGGGVGPMDLRLPAVGRAVGEEPLGRGVDSSELLRGEGPGAFLPRPASGSVLDLVRGGGLAPVGSVAASAAVRPAAAGGGAVGAGDAVDAAPAVAALDRLTRAAESAAAALEAVRRPASVDRTAALVAPPPASEWRM